MKKETHEEDEEEKTQSLKQLKCSACGGLSQLLLGFLKFKSKTEMIVTCSNCYRTILIEVNQLGKKIKSKGRSTSYFG